VSVFNRLAVQAISLHERPVPLVACGGSVFA
jgi:hypothetical protein